MKLLSIDSNNYTINLKQKNKTANPITGILIKK